MSARILIIGAGFGGVYTAKALLAQAKKGEVEIMLISEKDYFLFTPLLHEVAAGALDPRSIIEPLRHIFWREGLKVMKGRVKEIKSTEKKVLIETRSGSLEESYDYLVLSTGAETNYYGIGGARENTYPLKTLDDAQAVRKRIVECLEKAKEEKDPAKREKLLTFLIVGGGATGVELSAEIAEFAEDMIGHYRYEDRSQGRLDHWKKSNLTAKIILINASKDILEQFPPALRLAAEVRLMKKGIVVKSETTVVSVSAGALRTNDGQEYHSETIIWVAGVTPTLPALDFVPLKAESRLVADTHLRMKDHPDIFLLGDIAAYDDRPAGDRDAVGRPESRPRLVPMLAQAAVREAEVVAANILGSIDHRPLKVFSFHSKGSLISVGRWFAIGQIYSLNISGPLAWWLWRTVYLFKFGSNRKRLRIAWEWTRDLFRRRGGRGRT